MGILLSLAIAYTSILETIGVKNLLKRITSYEYMAFSSIIVIPFFLFLLFTSDIQSIDYSKFYIVLIIGLSSFLTNFLSLLSIKKLNIVVYDMIRKTYIIVTLILLYFTGIETINSTHFIGVFLVFIGLYLGINTKDHNVKLNKVGTSDNYGLILCSLSVFSSAISSVSVKYAVSNSIITPSATVVIKTLAVMLFSIYLFGSKKVEIHKIKEKPFEIILVSIYAPIIRLLLANAYKYTSVIVVDSMRMLSGVPLYIYNIRNGVEVFKITKLIGLLFCILGTVIVIIA